MHAIQQPEQELQGVMLGIALELRAVLGNSILKRKPEGQFGPSNNQIRAYKFQIYQWSLFSPDVGWQHRNNMEWEMVFLLKPALLGQCPRCYKGFLYRWRYLFFQKDYWCMFWPLKTPRVVSVEYFDSVDHPSSLKLLFLDCSGTCSLAPFLPSISTPFASVHPAGGTASCLTLPLSDFIHSHSINSLSLQMTTRRGEADFLEHQAWSFFTDSSTVCKTQVQTSLSVFRPQNVWSFSTFILLINIHWVPTTCQAPFSRLRTQQWTRQTGLPALRTLIFPAPPARSCSIV